MQFYGFQKLTLLDFPEHVACTLFTAGCNFRCPFCHNASLVTHIGDAEPIDSEEILSYLRKRRGLLDGVCISGGEPLLQDGLEEFIRAVKDMGYAVKLDTNGSLPERLEHLIREGLLDYVAMDIKNRKEKYDVTSGCEGSLPAVEQSVSLLLAGDLPFEFRTTVTSETHTPEDISSVCDWIKGAKRYFLQNFKDSGDILSSGLSPVSEQVMEHMLALAKEKGIDARSR
jgi:pyruvate formate lyase activating enzyme